VQIARPKPSFSSSFCPPAKDPSPCLKSFVVSLNRILFHETISRQYQADWSVNPLAFFQGNQWCCNEHRAQHCPPHSIFPFPSAYPDLTLLDRVVTSTSFRLRRTSLFEQPFAFFPPVLSPSFPPQALYIEKTFSTIFNDSCQFYCFDWPVSLRVSLRPSSLSFLRGHFPVSVA